MLDFAVGAPGAISDSTCVAGTSAAKRVRRPQEDSKLGDRCQVDFGQTRIAGGIVAYIFVVVLSASRA